MVAVSLGVHQENSQPGLKAKTIDLSPTIWEYTSVYLTNEVSSSFDRDGMNNDGQGNVVGKVEETPPALAVVERQWDERVLQAVNFSPLASEAFRVLRSKILVPSDGRPAPKTIVVTSVLPQEGKSFVSANLGIVLAQGIDQHALLVDCDLRLPTLANLFGIDNTHGLSDYLKNGTELSSLIHKTSMDKLSILTSGVSPVNPAELLGSTRMHELVSELARRYPDRFVVFDCPPLMVASESMTLAQVVDGVILVVRQGHAGKVLLEKAVSDIGKEKILGVVFNGHQTNPISAKLMNKSYSYYGNYYRKPAPPR
jgi:exopolysaccharide/PEP-CTERM locus tyrosine autokinase